MVNRSLFLDDRSDRIAAIGALDNLGDKESAPEIRKFLNDENWGVRLKAVVALREFGDKKSIPEIRQLFSDENGLVCAAAIKTLVIFNDRQSFPEIRNLIDDQSFSVRSAVVTALESSAITLPARSAKRIFPSPSVRLPAR